MEGSSLGGRLEEATTSLVRTAKGGGGLRVFPTASWPAGEKKKKKKNGRDVFWERDVSEALLLGKVKKRKVFFIGGEGRPLEERLRVEEKTIKKRSGTHFLRASTVPCRRERFSFPYCPPAGGGREGFLRPGKGTGKRDGGGEKSPPYRGPKRNPFSRPRRP